MNNLEIIERMKNVANVREDQELAKIFDLGKTAIANWKRGTGISLSYIFDFTQKYNCDLNWLLTGESVGIKLDPLENLLLTAFNKLDDEAKIGIISLLHTGGKNSGGINQTSGNNGSNNIFSGDNVMINTNTKNCEC